MLIVCGIESLGNDSAKARVNQVHVSNRHIHNSQNGMIIKK